MGLHIGYALQLLGRGLGDYAQIKMGQQRDDEERKRHDSERAQDVAFREQNRQDDLKQRQDSQNEHTQDAYRRAAENSRDQLAKLGVYPNQDFDQNAMQAQLKPMADAPGDTAALVVNALRTAGKKGVGQVYDQAPAALNKAMQGDGLSVPMEGGGFVAMDPSVRASMLNAEESRKARVQAAQIEASRARAGDVTQNAKEAEQEAQGQGFMKTSFPPPVARALSKAWNEILKANPGMSEGRAAYLAHEAVSKARPDIMPQKPQAGVGGALGKILGDDSPVTAAVAEGLGDGGQPVGAPAPAAPAKSKADRWEELVAGGMTPEQATAKVAAEYGGP